jgi:hypothetical protein
LGHQLGPTDMLLVHQVGALGVIKGGAHKLGYHLGPTQVTPGSQTLCASRSNILLVHPHGALGLINCGGHPGPTPGYPDAPIWCASSNNILLAHQVVGAPGVTYLGGAHLSGIHLPPPFLPSFVPLPHLCRPSSLPSSFSPLLPQF